MESSETMERKSTITGTKDLEVDTTKMSDGSFISRFNLSQKDLYSKEKYLISLMRFSICERIITKFFFQDNTKEFSLYPLLDNETMDEEKKDNIALRLSFCKQNYKNEECPLHFFAKLAEEIFTLLRANDVTMIKFEKYILDIEALLAEHFENNFYPKPIEEKLNTNFFDTMYLQKGRSNFIYSIESLNTIEQFIKILERQSLSTRIDEEFPLIRHLFCSAKIYYFYCDKLNREKNQNVGNLIIYIINQLGSKIEDLKKSKVKNYDVENYIMMSLFLIGRIIQNFSFYLYKKPELLDIYNSMKILKNWPYPIGNYCNDIMENIINECTFQGITLLNKLRQIYFIDSLNKKVNILETKFFRGALLIYSNEWEKRHSNTINSENPGCFNILKFLLHIKTKQKSYHSQKLVLRELVVKLLITFIFNSKTTFTDYNFRSIYSKFLSQYKSLYVDKKKKNKKNKNEEEDEDDDEYNNDDENNPINDIYKNSETWGPIKPSLDKLLKIIDIGFDKPIQDFNKEINLISQKLVDLNPSSTANDDDEENIVESKAFLPITSLRNYLKPIYYDVKKLYKAGGEEGGAGGGVNCVDIFDTYIKMFTSTVKKYFSYFLSSSNDEMVQNNLEILRKNFYNNYRINLVLVEEENTLNDLLENIENKIFKDIDKKVSDKDYNEFWQYFVDRKSHIQPKFILHVVPNYDSYNMNPFRILNDDDENNVKIDNEPSYLSEFIASNDNIYKNVVFMPFASSCDPSFFAYIPSCQNSEPNVMNFPSLNTMYSFLKKPLDYYLSDTNGIFNLDIYKITLNDDELNTNNTNIFRKLFWKNVEIFDESGKKIKLSLFCVDNLGLEYLDTKIFKLNDPFDIKIFNLFFRKNVPFNYNMNSNNGWLELFLDDKYNKKEVEKFCNYQSFLELNRKTKYYEEFFTDHTEIESKFKNYKVRKIVVETNSKDIKVKYDDSFDFVYKDKVDFNNKKKGEFAVKITIEPFYVHRSRYRLPIATFTTI